MSHILRSSVINGRRIELVRWDGEDGFFIYTYGRDGLLNSRHRFIDLDAAEQSYFKRIEQE